MPDKVAVVTTPPNADPYKIYVGNDDQTIHDMELIGEVPFYNFDADAVVYLEYVLYDKGFIAGEWVDETSEYRVAQLTPIS